MVSVHLCQRIATVAAGIAAAGVLAAPVSEDQARIAAASWLQQRGSVFGSAASERAAEPEWHEVVQVRAQRSGPVLAYGIEFASGGFLLLTADDLLNPVLGWAQSGKLCLDDVPGNALLWFLKNDLASRLAWRGELHAAATARSASSPAAVTVLAEFDAVRRQWQDLPADTATRATPRDPVLDVGPLMTTYWGQDYDTPNMSAAEKSPTFNYYTPEVDKGGSLVHAYSGCTATAMAQIMKYHDWPPAGAGSHTYDWTLRRTQLTADFTHSYDWDRMIDIYLYLPWEQQSPPSTEAQREAVGKLVYDCAVAVETDFGPSLSTAYLSSVPPALLEYFHYAGASIADYDADQAAGLRANIKDGLPGLVEFTSNGGHVVCADGLRQVQAGDPILYHLSFGWQGVNDGWYDITAGFHSTGGEGPVADEFGLPDYWWARMARAIIDIVPGLILEDLDGNGLGDFSLNWQSAAQLSLQACEVQEAIRITARGATLYLDEANPDRWATADNWQVRSEPGHASVWHGIPDTTALNHAEILSTEGFLHLHSGARLDLDGAAANFWGLQWSVEISYDGGRTWTVLEQFTGPVAGGSVIPETSLTWQHESIPLDPSGTHTGTTARIRFRVSVTGGNLTNQYRSGAISVCGWYLDNVALTDADLVLWTTLSASVTGNSYAIAGRPLGQYWYRVRPRVLDQWRGWSNRIAYEVVPVPQRTLTLAVEGAGDSSPAPGEHVYDQNTVVNVTASPDPHHVFVEWRDGSGATSAQNPLAVTLDTHKTQTAVFEPRQYDFTVVSAHGTPDPAPGVHAFAYGTEVNPACAGSPEAGAAGERFVLDGWELNAAGTVSSGSGAAFGPVTIGGDTTLTWQWRTEYEVACQAVGDGAVTVRTPAGATLGDWVTAGTEMVIAAAPDPGRVFDEWSGDVPAGAATRPVLNLRLQQPLALQAAFAVFVDSDSDSMHDGWEERYWPNPESPGAAADDNPDGDLLLNLAEYGLGTDPLVPTVRVMPGWTLVAVSRTALGQQTLGDQFVDLRPLSVVRWDAAAQEYVGAGVRSGRTAPTAPPIPPTEGFWLYSFEPEPVYVEVPGGAYSDGICQLSVGWHLVGPVLGGQLADLQIPGLQFWRWTGDNYELVLATLHSGCGYWIHCEEAITLDLP